MSNQIDCQVDLLNQLFCDIYKPKLLFKELMYNDKKISQYIYEHSLIQTK